MPCESHYRQNPFGKADVALSISLTAAISLTSIITVPLIVAFAHSYFLTDTTNPVNVTNTAQSMFALTVIPISPATTLRSAFPNIMINAELIVSKVAMTLFGAIVITALLSNWTLFITNVNILGGAVGLSAYSVPAALYGIFMYFVLLPLFRRIGKESVSR